MTAISLCRTGTNGLRYCFEVLIPDTRGIAGGFGDNGDARHKMHLSSLRSFGVPIVAYRSSKLVRVKRHVH